MRTSTRRRRKSYTVILFTSFAAASHGTLSVLDPRRLYADDHRAAQRHVLPADARWRGVRRRVARVAGTGLPGAGHGLRRARRRRLLPGACMAQALSLIHI